MALFAKPSCRTTSRTGGGADSTERARGVVTSGGHLPCASSNSVGAIKCVLAPACFDRRGVPHLY